MEKYLPGQVILSQAMRELLECGLVHPGIGFFHPETGKTEVILNPNNDAKVAEWLGQELDEGERK